MAYGDVGAVIETLEFDVGNGVDCWGINVNDDVFVVAYQGPGAPNNLYITTFTIDAAGAISNTILATLALSPSWGVLPHIIKIADNVFAIVYQGTNYYLTVETVSISDDGLTLSSIAELELNALDSRAPKIIHVTGNIYAVSYLQTAITTVKVSTFTIDSAGNIGGIGDTIDLTAAGSYYTNILNVSGDIYAVAYIDTANGISVATIEIAAGGLITDAVIDTQIIDAQVANSRISMVEALPGVFAVAHSGTGIDGYVSTVTISVAGTISAVLDTLEIWNADVTQFHITHIGLGICAVTFKKDVLLDGNITTISISAAGLITDLVIDTLDFETVNYMDGMLLPISGNIYAIFYGGEGNDGYVRTLDISTPPPGGPHHEMLMGMGP
uniref:Uncharacterized protein n=1 Tax=viral metagenome TaxID=1070528 RepID=A0A6M3XYA3_9ZZZZ